MDTTMERITLQPDRIDTHQSAASFPPPAVPIRARAPWKEPGEMVTIWMFPKIGGIFPPKWMVYFMETPNKMDDLGGFPMIFGNTHMWMHRKKSFGPTSTR